MSRRALLRNLADVAGQVGYDELKILLLLARRVRSGSDRYGRLDLRRDPRNFPRETLEELVDGLFYISAALLPHARRRRRGRRA